MKKIALLAVMVVALISCKNDDDSTTTTPVNVEFTFSQNWDGTKITNADYENTQYTNAAGTQLTLSKLNYLISDITLTDAHGTAYTAGDYNLIDSREGTNVNFTPDFKVPPGDYTVSLTFGFDDEDNVNSAYQDLNDAGWNVPGPLGGGYHYMRMEGSYINTVGATVNFQYHTIRANRHEILPPTVPVELLDTSFIVSLGSVTVGNSTNVEVKMNVAEWFKNPNEWDLNTFHSVLMPNFEAQKMMSANGKSAFSL